MQPLCALTDALPSRYWLVRANVSPALLQAPGAPVALLVEEGRIAAIERQPTPDAVQFDLDGATVLTRFVDPHVHLDKGDLLAMGLQPAESLMDAVAAVRADYARWTEDELRQRIDFGLRTAFAHGTRALNTYCDWSEPEGPLAWAVLQASREDWHGRIELLLTALVDVAHFAQEDQADVISRAVAMGGGRLGLFVYPGAEPRALRRAFECAARQGLAMDIHADEHLEPPVTQLGLIASLAREFGLGPRTVCSHACVLQMLSSPERLRVLESLAEAGVSLVCLPYTNLYLQDSARDCRGQRTTPQRRGILPVHEARAHGIALAFGSDNHRDPFFPGGDLDPLQLLALATLVAQLDEPLRDWADTITTIPARFLGLAWDGVLRPGAPADLVIHPGRNSREVLGRVGAGRRVLRNGQPLGQAEAQLPDFRDLDALRQSRASRTCA